MELNNEKGGFSMALFTYLSGNFYTQNQLLHSSDTSAMQLRDFQSRKMMPLPAYKLDVTLASTSYFGKFEEREQIEFYPKAYTNWLKQCHLFKEDKLAFTTFSEQFYIVKEALLAEEFWSPDTQFNANFDNFIEDQWHHFLAGTYGVCTKTGMPREILIKELAVQIISQIISTGVYSENNSHLVQISLKHLKAASSVLAPHEQDKGTLYRLIKELMSMGYISANGTEKVT
ncbi:DUF6058 family natural product biosynthesis protein [Pseudoalteromonas sp. Of7M-16]|uniref:DUF6058 family natural product biosynthesis protein n=1 Tax=Pseudoalteromonas sp. Of7M-16 TaxID=2917756 RepID=UPI001EF6DE58|nr:DUF6058 family natural product biosynthesis protein [Pseudoalteromonas sp. Of7M-16]MCG7547869.1 DUF6058 family natural product biosynthesis protein [Pseudoalteromonas sp. Of7M-16]